MGPTPRKPSARATLRRILRRGVRVVLRETVRRFKAKAREYHEAAAGALLREDDLPEERERKAAAVEAQALIYEFEGEQLAAMLVAVEP